MWKHPIDTMNLFWYQRVLLFIYYYIRNFKCLIINKEILIYKDKKMKQYIQIKNGYVLFHVKTRNGNNFYKRYYDKYYIV